jgi:bacterioferritin-associated ferredoxin
MPMFICLCNALDDVQLGQAIRDGAPATRGVHGGQEQ